MLYLIAWALSNVEFVERYKRRTRYIYDKYVRVTFFQLSFNGGGYVILWDRTLAWRERIKRSHLFRIRDGKTGYSQQKQKRRKHYSKMSNTITYQNRREACECVCFSAAASNCLPFSTWADWENWLWQFVAHAIVDQSKHWIKTVKNINQWNNFLWTVSYILTNQRLMLV